MSDNAYLVFQAIKRFPGLTISEITTCCALRRAQAAIAMLELKKQKLICRYFVKPVKDSVWYENTKAAKKQAISKYLYPKIEEKIEVIKNKPEKVVTVKSKPEKVVTVKIQPIQEEEPLIIKEIGIDDADLYWQKYWSTPKLTRLTMRPPA